MKKYRIKVNGKMYEVELEAVEETSGHVEAAAKAPAAAPAPASCEGGKEVKAPIGGSVIKVNVAVNDTVKKGDTLLVIEAMKLENEVPSPVDGKVLAVKVSKGNSVNTGDVLVIIG